MKACIIPRLSLYLLIFSSLYFRAQTKVKDDYLNKMPPVEQVLKDIQGSDELDTKARQSAACELLYDFIMAIADQRPKAKNQGSNLWLTDQEKKLNAMYSKESTKIILEVYDDLDPFKTNRFKEDSECAAWRDKRGGYFGDPNFASDILQKYVPLDLAKKYVKIKKKAMDEYMASPEYKADMKEKERVSKFREQKKMADVVRKDFYLKKYSIIGAIGLFLVVLLPWFHYYRSKSMELTKENLVARGKTYDICSVTGIVADASKTSTTQVYTTSGSYNSSTGTYSSPTVHSTTTIHDQLFLVDKKGGEHPVQLSGWNLAVRPGHKLTMLWAVKKGDSRGNYLMALNHTTNLKYYMTHLIKRMFSSRWSWAYTVIFIGLLAITPNTLQPYLKVVVDKMTKERTNIDENAINSALYFQIYIWTWGLYFAGLITNRIVLASNANQKTKEFTNFFNVPDFE